jgi:hypothetical protein
MKKPTISALIIAFAVLCVPLQKTQAVSPPPDGGYPGGNTAEGQAALLSLSTGGFNTAVGFLSLRTDTVGAFNTAIGAGALVANTADNNTATGTAALFSNTTGTANTANGTLALFTNTTGNSNTANGLQALFGNTTGSFNTAIGLHALISNTTGSDNNAIGAAALFGNTIGSDNTATGDLALSANTTGGSNTAIGAQALLSNTTGHDNTAIGAAALSNNTTGVANIALGGLAGGSVTTANNVICIGNGGANVSGGCFIGNIRGVTTGNADAIPVLIDSFGQLGTASSARRYKTDIKPIDKASESILALKPVSFRYKVHRDSTPQFGLIAEDVAEVDPDLVIYDADGKPYTVRYDAVNAMLLNEFLKEHSTVEELKKAVAALRTTVKEQAAQSKR